MLPPTKRVLALASVRTETENVRTFTFSDTYAFEPGQFVNIRFLEYDTLGKRSFSIASGPGEALEVTVKAVGRFTHALFDAPIGTRFEIHGPLGLPYIRHLSEAHVLICGGSGIAPFRSIMRDHRYASMRFTIINSMRTFADSIYRDELPSWNARIIHTLTREPHEGMRTGRIDETLLAQIPALSTQRIIICGPPGLVSSSIEHLLALGVPMQHIKTESWGN